MCYVISSCLLGENCKYEGGNNFNNRAKEIFDKGGCISLCPEVLGGFGVPRTRIEIKDGSGEEVLCGKTYVVNEKGENVTVECIRGAQRALEIAREKGFKKAILKARSPSCGFKWIYDGSFSGGLRKGNGVFSQILYDNGFDIMTEEEL